MNEAAEQLTSWDLPDARDQFIGELLGLNEQACQRLWDQFSGTTSVSGQDWQETVCVLGKTNHRAMRILRRSNAINNDHSLTTLVFHDLEGWEERYEEAMAGSPILFFEMQPDGEIMHGNRPWANALGYDAEALDEKKLADLVAEEQRDAFREMWKILLEGHAVRDKELKLVDAQGVLQHFWVSLFPVQDSGEGVTGVRGIAGDLAEQKGLAYALEAAEERFRPTVAGALFRRTPME
jgi:PAS domain S-box-containing protein